MRNEDTGSNIRRLCEQFAWRSRLRRFVAGQSWSLQPKCLFLVSYTRGVHVQILAQHTPTFVYYYYRMQKRVRLIMRTKCTFSCPSELYGREWKKMWCSPGSTGDKHHFHLSETAIRANFWYESTRFVHIVSCKVDVSRLLFGPLSHRSQRERAPTDAAWETEQKKGEISRVS
jgi:hypothetical protein